MSDVKEGSHPRPDGGGPHPHPQASLGFLLSQIGFVSSRAWQQQLAPMGIDPRHFLLLRYVASGEGQSQQALGEQLHIPPSRMVAIVDHLEERGLIERRPNPSDRRARALHVTPAGRALMAEAWRLAMEHEQRLGATLTPEERGELRRLLQKLAAELHLFPGVHPGLTAEE